MLMAMSCMVLLSGCAMEKKFYNTVLDLRDRQAFNYSQQVLDAIVSVRDRAELPIFFSVEAGQSSWSPNYSLSGGAQFLAPPFDARRTNLSSNGSIGETLSNGYQIRDFGPSAMTRLSALYAILCFPLQVGDKVLPNGALKTIVDEADSPAQFLISAKMKNGKYLGVPKEKQQEFLRFAQDVTFWTRVGAPDANDLTSTAGLIYRFSADFASTEMALAKAVATKSYFEGATGTLADKLAKKQQDYDAVVKEAKTSKSNPAIMKLLVQTKNNELQKVMEGDESNKSELKKASTAVRDSTRKLKGSLLLFATALTKIKSVDPAAAQINVEEIVKPLQDRADRIAAGNFADLEVPMPSAVGLGAEDSMDKLYRDRFQFLPQRFDASRQGTQ